MYSLSYDSTEYAATLKDKLGGYNDYPPNMHWITRDEWEDNCLCNIYTPTWIDHRQAWGKGKDGEHVGPMEQLTLYIMRDLSGWGYSHRYVWSGTGGRSYEVRYFRFAYCKHEWKGVPELSRMCYHVSRCTKCKIERHIDSSD